MPPDTNAPLPDDWEYQDAVGSYYEAIAAQRERYLAGEPLPWFFRSSRETEDGR